MTNEISTIPDEDGVDPMTEHFLRSAQVVDAINAALPQGSKALEPIPHGYVFKKRDRETVSVAFHAVAELIGGVPRMAQWANANPDKFYTLYSKLLPSETETPTGNVTIHVSSDIGRNALDLVSLDAQGKVIDLDEELPE